jgi:hypothetical protein|tara:strand:+ start:323 stop:496 length:174 start_codon:yes stop_codon:yes gene_type:complete
MENNRRSVIRKDGDTYVVDLFEGNTLVQSRRLDGKSQLYAEDVSTNWDTGIIQLLVD